MNASVPRAERAGERGAAGGFALGCLLPALGLVAGNLTMPLWFDRVAGQFRDVMLAWMVFHFGLLFMSVLLSVPAMLIGFVARRTAAGKVALFGGLAVTGTAVGVFVWS